MQAFDDDKGKGNWSTLPNHCWDESDPHDLIDFPVADCWLRDYHSKGMTPRCPEPNIRVQLDQMAERLERLETAMRNRPRPRVVRPVTQSVPVTRPQVEWPAAAKIKKATKGTG